MTDRIQAILCRNPPVSSPQLAEALVALAREWRPQVLARLRRPAPEEVDDLLQAALLELVLEAGGRPRALAPPDAACPRAWRRRVLGNWLVDQLRAKHRRLHAVQAMAAGWSPRVEKTQWRRAKQRRTECPPGLDDVAGRGSLPWMEAISDSVDERRRLRRLLPELPVCRRVLVVMALGMDPSPYARELAARLDDSVSAVAWRMRQAGAAPHDARHDYLSTAMVRVVYPFPKSLPAAMEAARKTFERAIGDLRRRSERIDGRQAA